MATRTNLKDWLINIRKHSGPLDIPQCLVKGYLLGINGDNYSSYLIESFSRNQPNAFFNKLNGCFCGYIQSNSHIWVFTDRYGFGKVYICDTIDRLIIGTSFNDIVRRLDKISLDVVAIYEFLKFSYPLSTKTYIEQVRLLAPGSYLEIDSQTGNIIKQNRYWEYAFSESYRDELPKMQEKLYELLNIAVSDNLNNIDAKYAIANLGGSDSRTIIALSSQRQLHETLYTFGHSQCDPFIIAERVSKIVQLPQHFIEINPDFIPKYVDTFLERRPMQYLAGAVYYSVMQDLKLLNIDINVTGLLGDNVLGIHLADEYLQLQSDDDLLSLHSKVDAETLAEFIRMDNKKARDHFTEVLEQIDQQDPIHRYDQWNWENRQFRYIMDEAWINSLDEIDFRIPFVHNDLVDFMFSLPFEFRFLRRLSFSTISRYFPKLSKVRLECRGNNMYKHEVTMHHVFDQKLQSVIRFLYYRERGMHSHQQWGRWLNHRLNYAFIQESMKRPSVIFSELFFPSRILSNVSTLFSQNPAFLSRLFTVKLWLERYIEKSI